MQQVKAPDLSILTDGGWGCISLSSGLAVSACLTSPLSVVSSVPLFASLASVPDPSCSCSASSVMSADSVPAAVTSVDWSVLGVISLDHFSTTDRIRLSRNIVLLPIGRSFSVVKIYTKRHDKLYARDGKFCTTFKRRRFCIDLGPLRGSSSTVDALSQPGWNPINHKMVGWSALLTASS